MVPEVMLPELMLPEFMLPESVLPELMLLEFMLPEFVLPATPELLVPLPAVPPVPVTVSWVAIPSDMPCIAAFGAPRLFGARAWTCSAGGAGVDPTEDDMEEAVSAGVPIVMLRAPGLVRGTPWNAVARSTIRCSLRCDWIALGIWARSAC
jgi:hypothetical protein